MFKRLKRKGKKGKVNLSNVKQKVDPKTIWSVGDKIGEGAMGTVHKVSNKSSGVKCACKILKIECKDDIEEFATEVDCLVPIKHPNIVRIHDAYMYQKKFWVVLELCEGGAFDDILIDRKGQGLSEPQVKSAAKQLLSALAYLHSNGIYHRDVKGSNLLLTEKGIIKLTDFGSCSMGNQDGKRRDTFLGSPYWMAPEVIECDDSSITRKAGYNHKADIWAFGVTIIELAQCDPPHQELNPMRAMIRIVKSPPPALNNSRKWSASLHDFLDHCLVKQQDLRSTAAELMQHKYVSGQADLRTLIPLLAHSVMVPTTNSNSQSASAVLAAQLKESALNKGMELTSDGEEEDTFGFGG